MRDVGVDDFFTQPGILGTVQADVVECFEALAEILLQCGLVADVGAISVFELFELLDQVFVRFGFLWSFNCPVNTICWT